MQELTDAETRLYEQWRALRERERPLLAERESAEADFRDRSANPENPHHFGDPQAQGAHVVARLETLRAHLDGAVLKHEAVARLVHEKLREIEGNQVAQERSIALLSQWQNMRLQRWLMIWTAVIALATIASLFKK